MGKVDNGFTKGEIPKGAGNEKSNLSYSKLIKGTDEEKKRWKQ